MTVCRWFDFKKDGNAGPFRFRLRRKDGSADPYSAATFVDARGQSTKLRAGEFSLQPLSENWTSSVTHATYPVRWKIMVPKFNIELELKTSLPSQELTSGVGTLTPSYWEGAVTYEGTRAGSKIQGVGYLEMTGYDRPFEMGAEKENSPQSSQRAQSGRE